MEQFDVLDVYGNFTGRTCDKGTPLADGQYYLGVHVYIHNAAGEFLLQQRALDKLFLPGGWEVLLEHVVAGETSIEGAIRGVKEEIGLIADESKMRLGKRFIWEKYHHIIDVYFLVADFDLSELVLQPREVIAVKMVSKAEMLGVVAGMHYRPASYREFIAEQIQKLDICKIPS